MKKHKSWKQTRKNITQSQGDFCYWDTPLKSCFKVSRLWSVLPDWYVLAELGNQPERRIQPLKFIVGHVGHDHHHETCGAARVHTGHYPILWKRPNRRILEIAGMIFGSCRQCYQLIVFGLCRTSVCKQTIKPKAGAQRTDRNISVAADPLWVSWRQPADI